MVMPPHESFGDEGAPARQPVAEERRELVLHLPAGGVEGRERQGLRAEVRLPRIQPAEIRHDRGARLVVPGDSLKPADGGPMRMGSALPLRSQRRAGHGESPRQALDFPVAQSPEPVLGTPSRRTDLGGPLDDRPRSREDIVPEVGLEAVEPATEDERVGRMDVEERDAARAAAAAAWDRLAETPGGPGELGVEASEGLEQRFAELS